MLIRYLSIISVMCAVLLAVRAESSVVLDKVVAVVNQEVITWSELYRTMEVDATPQLKAMTPAERRKIFRESEAEFLENIINMRLQIQEAGRLNIRVGEDELSEAISEIRKKYGLSDASFRESLEKEGMTYSDYRRRLSEQILVSKVVNFQVRSKIIVSDTDVEKFMDTNRRLFQDTEGYRIRQILFRKPKDGDTAVCETRAAEVIGKLKEGAAFAELAKSYSDDPSAASGGEIGFFAKRDLAKEFADALETMKPGETSTPFWTSQGLHILLLEEKTEPKSRAELREEARRMLTNRMFSEKYEAWIKSLRERAFIEIRD